MPYTPFAIGAWIGTLIGLGVGFDRNERTDLRDLLGAIGGGMGLLVWLIISF
jgi:hypothetical protein